jgi:hypothetical protein
MNAISLFIDGLPKSSFQRYRTFNPIWSQRQKARNMMAQGNALS